MKYTVSRSIPQDMLESLIQGFKNQGLKVTNIVVDSRVQSFDVHGERFMFAEDFGQVPKRTIIEMTKSMISGAVKKALERSKELHQQGGGENEVKAAKLAKQSARVLTKMKKEGSEVDENFGSLGVPARRNQSQPVSFEKGDQKPKKPANPEQTPVKEDSGINPDIITSHYISSHGKAPSGKGLWIFGIGSRDTNDHFSFNGQYSEARKRAMEVAKEQGAARVYVMEAFNTHSFNIEVTKTQVGKTFEITLIQEGIEVAKTAVISEKAADETIKKWTEKAVRDSADTFKDIEKSIPEVKKSAEQKEEEKLTAQAVKDRIARFKKELGLSNEVVATLDPTADKQVTEGIVIRLKGYDYQPVFSEELIKEALTSQTNTDAKARQEEIERLSSSLGQMDVKEGDDVFYAQVTASPLSASIDVLLPQQKLKVEEVTKSDVYLTDGKNNLKFPATPIVNQLMFTSIPQTFSTVDELKKFVLTVTLNLKLETWNDISWKSFDPNDPVAFDVDIESFLETIKDSNIHESLNKGANDTREKRIQRALGAWDKKAVNESVMSDLDIELSDILDPIVSGVKSGEIDADSAGDQYIIAVSSFIKKTKGDQPDDTGYSNLIWTLADQKFDDMMLEGWVQPPSKEQLLTPEALQRKYRMYSETLLMTMAKRGDFRAKRELNRRHAEDDDINPAVQEEGTSDYGVKFDEDDIKFRTACAKAQRISKEEDVVQHINKDKESGQYYVSDWYDYEETVRSYASGVQKENLNEAAFEIEYEVKGDSETTTGKTTYQAKDEATARQRFVDDHKEKGNVNIKSVKSVVTEVSDQLAYRAGANVAKNKSGDEEFLTKQVKEQVIEEKMVDFPFEQLVSVVRKAALMVPEDMQDAVSFLAETLRKRDLARAGKILTRMPETAKLIIRKLAPSQLTYALDAIGA